MAGLGVDGSATGVGIGDFADGFEGVEIKDGDARASSGARNVETASGGIGAFAENSNGALSSLKALISFTSSRSPCESLNWSRGTDDSYGISLSTQ